MTTREELKAAVCGAIDARRDEIVALGEEIFCQPELGYKEHRTAERIARAFRDLDLRPETGLAVTGVKAYLPGRADGPTVCVIGELDSILVRDHLQADPVTGAAHACGHNAQLAMMLGAGMGLAGAGAMDQLGGRAVLFAVPAEEYVEVDYRLGLRREGKIELLGGKQELVRIGAFDDVDMAMMIHTTSNPDDGKFALSASSNGFLAKQARFLGREAHAGGAPHKGINALNAATLALSAIHFQRETFRDQDSIRVHPIITRGGDLVNVIPHDVSMEMYVRGKTTEAIEDASHKVDRALRAGALALGASVAITTVPGYLPLANDPNLATIFKGNAAQLVGEQSIVQIGHRSGSTDMGDLTQIMPALHPYTGGAVGTGHGRDYRVADPEQGYINGAKAMAMTVVDLLWDGATEARRVLAESNPPMTKQQYLDFMARTYREERYAGDGG